MKKSQMEGLLYHVYDENKGLESEKKMRNEENLTLYNEVRLVPDEAKKEIRGGRMNGKTSIEPMWRIKTLTEQFGPCGLGWYYVPVRKWMETVGEEIVVFVDIELYVKFGGEWSKPIVGTGGDKLASKERDGIYLSEECYKKATTDAISVACKQLGIGADVYWEGGRTAGRKERTSDSRSAASSVSQVLAPSGRNGLETKYINSLLNELKRTGVGKNSLLRSYKKNVLGELSFEEYKDAMDKLTVRQDKPLDSAFIPPDGQEDNLLPWNQREERAKESQSPALMQGSGGRDRAFLSSAKAEHTLSAPLIEDGYTYCGSFGGS